MLHAKGPFLTVDLGDETSQTKDIDGILESYAGGHRVAIRLAHERAPSDVGPFSPDNRVYFSTGPMQVSNMSFTGRTNCTSVSPLTGDLCSSNAGGFVSRNFADAGYSAAELAGVSGELVVLHATDEGVEFEAVPDLTGATVPETVAYFDNEHDIEADRTMVVGPAGENLVRFAPIMTSEECTFGRDGLGAVLGPKNVKALTFSGDAAPDIEIPASQMGIHREAATDDHIMKRQGTVAALDLANEMDGLPSYYFSERHLEGAEGINSDAIEQKRYKKGTCSACAFACKFPMRDEAAGVETEGPEFEVTMAFGSNSGVDDIVEVMKSNELCDRYGLDAISAGNTVTAYLASEDEFGNTDLIHDLVEKIALCEGVGNDLAEGIARMHDGLDVENWMVKGMDFAAHEDRVLHGQRLSYAVANRGADHMYAVLYSQEYPLVGKDDAYPPEGSEGKSKRLIEKENQVALNDSGIVCKFSWDFMTPERYEVLFGADFENLLAVGDHIVMLERHFNNQRGFDHGDDTLPYADELDGFEAALGAYYERRGWTDDGVVPPGNVPA